MQYLTEVDDRIIRWADATRRLRLLASTKPAEIRERIMVDLDDADGQLQVLRREAEELRKAAGQAWHDLASAISHRWDRFQVAYDSARARL